MLNRPVPQPNVGRIWPSNPFVARGLCPFCGGTEEVLQKPERLIGATYAFDDPWKGDEHIGPCPVCCGQDYDEERR